MSMDRPEQYPEVSSEELGIVPPQDGPRADWPKKIRMLSASELDRLTIDSAGRFYWDGKLVNYESLHHSRGEAPKVDPLDRNAFELLDRAALELADRGDAHATMTIGPQPAVEPARPAPEVRAIDLDAPSVAPAPQVASPADVVPAGHATLVAPVVRGPSERIRVSLSGWQSFGLIVAILCLLVGTASLAAQGWVATHAWGCRTGVVTQYCPPPPPAPTVPQRPDIPA